MFGRYGRDFTRMAAAAVIAAVALASPGVGARADDSAPPAAAADEGAVRKVTKTLERFDGSHNPTLRPLVKKLGIVADPGQPADFVVNARPAGEEDYIDTGRKETEHPLKVKTPAELKAMMADFDAVKVRHDAIRSTFAPAVKAVAAAEAAAAAKAAKPKKAAAPATAAQ